MGRQPKDYDVATNATPDQIRNVFGRRRTLAIGAAFGVITVVGPKPAGQVEIATFRCDATYTDGRHPDHVTFSSAEEDAQRRDFTINGLFHDPLTGQDIDYVNGVADLNSKLIRAIGDPHERVAEDKLRMLRAVRFAATFGFRIESQTFAAVREHAPELNIVSAERISEEMRRMLVHPARRQAMELLVAAELLPVILPEVTRSAETPGDQRNWFHGEHWDTTLRILERLDEPTFSAALAVLLRGPYQKEDEHRVTDICRRWRLSNEVIDGVLLCLRNELLLRGADQQAWPRVQRVLTSPRIDELLTYVAAVGGAMDDDSRGVEFCRGKLSLDADQWNPAPLLTGDDLKQAGLSPGPGFRRILDCVRDAQLNGEIAGKAQALEAAMRLSATETTE